MDHYPKVFKQKKWNSTSWFCPPSAHPLYRGRDVARKVEDAKVKVGQDPRARCELLFALDAASLEAIDLAEKAGRCG